MSAKVFQNKKTKKTKKKTKKHTPTPQIFSIPWVWFFCFFCFFFVFLVFSRFLLLLVESLKKTKKNKKKQKRHTPTPQILSIPWVWFFLFFFVFFLFSRGFCHFWWKALRKPKNTCITLYKLFNCSNLFHVFISCFSIHYFCLIYPFNHLMTWSGRWPPGAFNLIYLYNLRKMN